MIEDFLVSIHKTVGGLMKKNLIIGLFLMFVLLVGCSKATDQQHDNGDVEPIVNSKQGVIRHIPSFPTEVVPLYQVTNVNGSEYSVREDYNYVIGKDFYFIEFESSATREEISVFYKDLMDEVDTQSSLSDFSFEGYVDDRRISVIIMDWTYQESFGVVVAISVGEHPSKYAEFNRYFESLPDGMVEVHENASKPHYFYSESYRSHYVRYMISFFTFADQEEFLDIYRTEHQSKQEFVEEEDDFAIRFKWVDDGYRITFSYQKTPSYLGNGVGLTLDKDLDD
jgi:hypothetical protein